MNHNPVTAIALLLGARRLHERAGCRPSKSGLIDDRCAECRTFDALVADETRRGWHPTTFDRKFLKALGIAAA